MNLAHLVELIAPDPHIVRGFDTNTNLAILDANDGDDDIVTNLDPLANFPCQNQHLGNPFQNFKD